jgi:uncharacterized protein (TIGR02246 family)
MKKALLGFSIGILMGVVLLLAGCGTAQQAADTDADIEAIKSLSEQLQDAYIARNWERFSGFFTDDGVWMPPNLEPLVGKEAWWSWAQQWWDQSSVEQLSVSLEEIVVAGDWAFERHSETHVIIPKASGEPSQLYFKGVWILQRQDDGSWQIARYIWNSSPAPTAEN